MFESVHLVFEIEAVREQRDLKALVGCVFGIGGLALLLATVEQGEVLEVLRLVERLFFITESRELRKTILALVLRVEFYSVRAFTFEVLILGSFGMRVRFWRMFPVSSSPGASSGTFSSVMGVRSVILSRKLTSVKLRLNTC